jgi:hypothetical protein
VTKRLAILVHFVHETDQPTSRDTRRALVLALLGVLAAGCLTLASRADAYVYWANDGGSTLGRATLDGAVQSESSTPLHGSAVATNGQSATGWRVKPASATASVTLYVICGP